jgi:ABC-type amino acid transport system permease subunit
MSLLLAVSSGGGVAYSLSGDAGAYTLTGQAAGFKVGHVLSGAVGVYALSGQAATLTYASGSVAYSLSGATGAYAITGQAAAFGYAAGAVGAGVGSKTLAEYEAEWRDRPIEELPAKVRRLVKRKAAREVYFADPLPEVAQVYVDRLKGQRYQAELAEMRALLDLSAQVSETQADIARAAVQMARKKQAEAAQALEEFDVMYVATILAEA